ncbi:hypothetical protein DWB84_03445 [Saccharophagus sp. K07]|nr:hypothetical protein [Saccharophagus sp. K07]
MLGSVGAAPVGVEPHINDEDGDSVPDVYDQCPGTKVGAPVNKFGCEIEDISSMPSFHWPPPQPSAYYRLSGITGATFGEVSNMLQDKLLDAGYSQFSFYSVPTGIAMVTEFERIRKNGVPYPVPHRWSDPDKRLKLEEWSLQAYLNALLTSNPGYYRSMVFLITHEAHAFKLGDPPKDENAVRSFKLDGAVNLPVLIQDALFTKNHKVTVLVYEMKKVEGHEAMLTKLGLTVKDHFKASKIDIGGNHD